MEDCLVLIAGALERVGNRLAAMVGVVDRGEGTDSRFLSNGAQRDDDQPQNHNASASRGYISVGIMHIHKYLILFLCISLALKHPWENARNRLENLRRPQQGKGIHWVREVPFYPSVIADFLRRHRLHLLVLPSRQVCDSQSRQKRGHCPTSMQSMRPALSEQSQS